MKKGLIGSIFLVVLQKMNMGVASLYQAVSQFPCSAKKNEWAYNDSSGRGKFIESLLIVPKN